MIRAMVAVSNTLTNLAAVLIIEIRDVAMLLAVIPRLRVICHVAADMTNIAIIEVFKVSVSGACVIGVNSVITIGITGTAEIVFCHNQFTVLSYVWYIVCVVMLNG